MKSSTASLSNTDPLVVVTQYAVRNFKLNISDDTIKDSLLKHPDYPNISSLSEVFSGLKIKNKALRIKSSQLVELDPFFFAYLLGQGLVFVTKISSGNIKYYSPTVGLATETIEKFNEKWNGITILFDHSDAVTENNFKQQILNSKLKRLRFPLSIFLLLFLVGSALFSTGLSTATILLLVKYAGVATCIALSVLGIKGESNHFKFCQIGNKLDCNAVLNSPASKLFSWLSFSDIGLVYFIGGFVALSLGIFVHPTPAIIFLLSALAVPAFFYTFYSLYYQAFIIKKWCLLCLIVLALIWTECVLFFSHIANTGLTIPGFAGTSLVLFSFISTVVVWSYLKETFVKSSLLKDFKYRFYRISNNKDVFEVLHAKGPSFNTKFKSNHVSIGKNSAENKISIVLNPFCEKCATEYRLLLDLHANHPEDINISFLFAGNTDDQANDLTNKVSRYVIELFYQLEETEFCNALSSWFKNKDYEELKSKYQAHHYSERANKTFGEHLKWLQQHQIRQTPALFFNDRRLSDYYSVEQLSHFL